MAGETLSRDVNLKFEKPVKVWRLDLTREEKVAIAKEAKEFGVITIANRTGLPMKYVRSWVGAYCRKPKDSSAKKIRVPTVGDKRRRGYKDENWPLPQELKVGTMTEAMNKGQPEQPVVADWEQEYKKLKERFDGYRQAVLDMLGQQRIDITGSKG